MRSATPKVLHSIGGRTLLGHVLATGRALQPEHLVTVVRHERDAVAAEITACDPESLIADQDEIPGTGRAVQCALGALDAAAAGRALGGEQDRNARPAADSLGLQGTVVVLYGDVPLLRPDTLELLIAAHHDGPNAVTVLTAHPPDATGYGRIVRDEAGQVTRIVEHKDASAAELAIGEINSGIYAFDAAVLRGGLAAIDRDNSQGEMYLTDVVAHAHAGGQRVGAMQVPEFIEVEGANDRVQLAALGAELNRRTLREWMLAGVTVVDPATTWVDVEVQIEPDVTLLPGTQLHGQTQVLTGAVIGPDSTLVDVQVGQGSTVTRTHATGAQIGDGASVGPFAYLRPGAVLGSEGKIGTFVEIKNSTIGAGSKVPHLSYLGDATVGRGANIGAASVTVNYDGVTKNRTTIGDHARTGADNMFVAPVQIGDGAYTGAGTVVRRDVPPGALGVSGGQQRNIEGWVASRRPGTPSAHAAQLASGQDPATAHLSPQAKAERQRAADQDADDDRRPDRSARSGPGDDGAGRDHKADRGGPAESEGGERR